MPANCADTVPYLGATPPSGDPLAALDLAAVHDPPRLGVERVAPVQHGEVVPHQQVADLPSMAHGKARLCGVRPQRIEQGVAVGDAEPQHVGIWTPAEE